MKKIFPYLFGAFALFLMSFDDKKDKKNKVKITLLDGKMQKRGCDAGGCGHFGAKRTTHIHQGLDILCENNGKVYAPYDSIVKRLVNPYIDDEYSGIELYVPKLEITIKIMYCKPFSGIILTKVSQGQVIASCQDISLKYKNVPSHLHVEILKDGHYIDPEIYLF
jgi:hypothetical protein